MPQQAPYKQLCLQYLRGLTYQLHPLFFENSDHYKRDFVSVEDVVEAHCKLLGNTATGVYNIGTGQPVSFQDVAEAIAAKYNAVIETIPMPENLQRQYQAFTCADINRLNSVIEMRWTDIRDYISAHDYARSDADHLDQDHA